MKKNVMMRIASVLLIAVLISTCGISGTYAKYVSKGTAENTARVAKWGVTVTATGDGSMFAQTYNETGSVTVEASEKVVAPGTAGSLVDFTVTGDPEVDVRVKFVATVDLGANWIADGNYYCPLVVKVGSTTINGLDPALNSADKFEAAIKAAIDGVTASYSTEETISAAVLDVSWEWPFFIDDNHDKLDTDLGNLIADGDANNDPKITISVDCIVEQVD